MSEQTEQTELAFNKALEILDRITAKCDQMLAILDAHKNYYEKDKPNEPER